MVKWTCICMLYISQKTILHMHWPVIQTEPMALDKSTWGYTRAHARQEWRLQDLHSLWTTRAPEGNDLKTSSINHVGVEAFDTRNAVHHSVAAAHLDWVLWVHYVAHVIGSWRDRRWPGQPRANTLRMDSDNLLRESQWSTCLTVKCRPPVWLQI